MNLGVADFKLSITKALANQLADALATLTPQPLTLENIEALHPRPGVYELYLQGDRVYVGKAKSSLPERLSQHRRKLSGRQKIAVADLSFKCLYVDEDLDSASPERMLIAMYSASGTSPWNNNGFGNKDPGRNRDRTELKAKHFDAHYPISLDVEFALVHEDTELRVDQLVDRLKASLPYNLRRDKKTHIAELRASVAKVPAGRHTARQLLSLVVAALPPGWQATALPGYVILYREEADYPSATLLLRRQGDGAVAELEGRAIIAAGDVEEDLAEQEVDE